MISQTWWTRSCLSFRTYRSLSFLKLARNSLEKAGEGASHPHHLFFHRQFQLPVLRCRLTIMMDSSSEGRRSPSRQKSTPIMTMDSSSEGRRSPSRQRSARFDVSKSMDRLRSSMVGGVTAQTTDHLRRRNENLCQISSRQKPYLCYLIGFLPAHQ